MVISRDLYTLYTGIVNIWRKKVLVTLSYFKIFITQFAKMAC